MSAGGGLFDDLESLTRGFGDGLDGHLGAVPQSRADPYAGASFGARPGGLLEGVLTGNRPDLFAGTGPSGADLFAGTTAGGGDPFAGVAWGSGGQQGNGGPGGLLGGLFSGIGTAAHNLFAGAFNPKPPAPYGQGPATGATAAGTAGGDFSGPATSDDNKTLTPQQIDAWIAQTRGNSPLVGKGQAILDAANQYGVSVPLMLGIFLKESELGTTAGDQKILSGITDPSRDQGLGGQRAFQGFTTWEDAIAATARLLGSATYRGKSLGDQVSIWYVGQPGAWEQTDQAGNGTVRDYVNQVGQVYQQLGVPFNAGQAGTPRAQAGSANATGYSFPVLGYKGSIDLHHGESANAADIMAPAGTGIVAMRGGTVVDASYNQLGGNTVTIRGDDGLLYYYAHMQQPALVAAGAHIQTGAALGYVGNTGNAANTPSHLHLGIGRDIQSGDGAEGGAGTPWGPGPDQNARGLLTWVLNAH